MADTITGGSNKDRARLAREAGIGKLSLLAILAGAVTTFGSWPSWSRPSWPPS